MLRRSVYSYLGNVLCGLHSQTQRHLFALSDERRGFFVDAAFSSGRLSSKSVVQSNLKAETKLHVNPGRKPDNCRLRQSCLRTHDMGLLLGTFGASALYRQTGSGSQTTSLLPF